MSNNTNSCIANSCYGVYRTSFDRMMQNKHSPFCKPSSQLVCDKAGNPVLAQPKDRIVEKYQARRAHMMRARAMQARQAARRQRIERFEQRAPPPPPKGEGGGKKKAVVLTKDWCGYCKKIKEEMKDIIRMLDEMGIDLEMPEDDDEVNALMAEHKEKGATGFPATLIMEGDEVKDVVSGYMPAERFVKAVQSKY